MRMHFPLLLALTTACPAFAGVKDDFLDGAYVFNAKACEKLKALAAGTSPAAETEPWVMRADGISFWEGGCDFSKIEKRGRKSWHVTASCGEGPDVYVESYLFRRRSKTTFSVTLTTPGASAENRVPKRYFRCDVPPGLPQR